jgi:hypothetical protein
MTETFYIMKISALLFTAAVIATSCCSAKQAHTTTAQNTVNKTQLTENKATVSHGKLIGISQPISTIAKTPKTLVTQETKVPVVKTEIEPISTPPTIVEMTEVEPTVEAFVLDHTELHRPFNTLLKDNVSSAGNVNYNGFKSNRKTLLAYITALGENLPEDNWTKNEKLAYWMNAYNAMTIDLILRNQPIASIKDIKNPWDQRLWKLGEKYYNLDEIEHQILRKMGDARIHFGINCASFSCPPLLNEAFIPSNVDAQLDLVAKKFINDSSRNSIAENNVEISNIFKWFSKDFKQNGSLIDFLNKFSEVEISEDAKVRYMDYDWALNK